MLSDFARPLDWNAQLLSGFSTFSQTFNLPLFVVFSIIIKENLQKQTELFNHKVFSRRKLNERNEKLAAFEKGVEEIIEETQQAKEKITKEIREKYKENLEELKNMPQNDLVLKIMQEVHKKLDEEIAESIENIESNKKKQIQYLRSNLKLNSLTNLK